MAEFPEKSPYLIICAQTLHAPTTLSIPPLRKGGSRRAIHFLGPAANLLTSRNRRTHRIPRDFSILDHPCAIFIPIRRPLPPWAFRHPRDSASGRRARTALGCASRLNDSPSVYPLSSILRPPSSILHPRSSIIPSPLRIRQSELVAIWNKHVTNSEKASRYRPFFQI